MTVDDSVQLGGHDHFEMQANIEDRACGAAQLFAALADAPRVGAE
jgi:hypothetical protein